MHPAGNTTGTVHTDRMIFGLHVLCLTCHITFETSVLPLLMATNWSYLTSTDVTGRRRVWVPRARHENQLRRIGKGRRIKHVYSIIMDIRAREFA